MIIEKPSKSSKDAGNVFVQILRRKESQIGGKYLGIEMNATTPFRSESPLRTAQPTTKQRRER
jgi:hypothetical protein